MHKLKNSFEKTFESGRLEPFVREKLAEFKSLFPNESNFKIIRMTIAQFGSVRLINKFVDSVTDNFELFLNEIKIHDRSVFGENQDFKEFDYDVRDFFAEDEP